MCVFSPQDRQSNTVPKGSHGGVRRFYVRDPFGRLLNILAHEIIVGPERRLSIRFRRSRTDMEICF